MAEAVKTQIIKTKPGRPAPQTSDTALRRQLMDLGAAPFNLRLPETHALPLILHPDEKILGLVYGRYHQDLDHSVGRGVLVATDNRIFLLDKKPLYVKSDEIIYDAVSGVNYQRAGLAGTVQLHTKIGDIRVRTLNQKCAKSFVEAVELQLFGYGEGVPS